MPCQIENFILPITLTTKATVRYLILLHKQEMPPFIFPLHFCQVTEKKINIQQKKIFYQSFEYFWERNHLEVMCQGTLSASFSPFLSRRTGLKKQKHF